MHNQTIYIPPSRRGSVATWRAESSLLDRACYWACIIAGLYFGGSIIITHFGG